jgi:hypothetical protein
MSGADLLVEIAVQTTAVEGLAVRKGMLADLIERVTIGQLGQAQLTELFRCRHQFEFGGKRGLHILVFFFRLIQSERRRFLPHLKVVGIRAARLMKLARSSP